jgi:hypothetical protein
MFKGPASQRNLTPVFHRCYPVLVNTSYQQSAAPPSSWSSRCVCKWLYYLSDTLERFHIQNVMLCRLHRYKLLTFCWTFQIYNTYCNGVYSIVKQKYLKQKLINQHKYILSEPHSMFWITRPSSDVHRIEIYKQLQLVTQRFNLNTCDIPHYKMLQ